MKTIDKIYGAQKINMGGVILDQALPVGNLDSVDPFILIHHWKQNFTAGGKQSELGVGPHPHRGFAPVTLIFEGGVYHQDTLGNKSIIEKGGTQWMNSGKGIIHSERPSEKIAQSGGEFEIIQFWVNSPASQKMNEPDYQSLTHEETPVIISDGGLVKTGIVAGNFDETEGRIKTTSKLLVLRFDISKGGKIKLPVSDNFNTLIYQLDGKLLINNEKMTGAKDLINFKLEGNNISLEGIEDTRAILLAGEPLNEKVYSYGPFVMSSQKEIYDAVHDYNSGKMGKLIEDFNFEQFASENNI